MMSKLFITGNAADLIAGKMIFNADMFITKNQLITAGIYDISLLETYRDTDYVIEEHVKKKESAGGLIFHLPLTSASGYIDEVNRIGPTSNTATFNNSEGALYCDGTSVRYSGFPDFNLSKGLTFSICLKRKSTATGGAELAMMTDGDPGIAWWTEEFGIQPYNANEGICSFPYIFGASARTSPYLDTNWHLYTGTVTKNENGKCTISLYVDKMLKAQVSPDFKYMVNLQFRYLRLGNDESRNCFNGYYKDCKIFNKVLTQEEIQLL